jgi:hypothetical protein
MCKNKGVEKIEINKNELTQLDRERKKDKNKIIIRRREALS